MATRHVGPQPCSTTTAKGAAPTWEPGGKMWAARPASVPGRAASTSQESRAALTSPMWMMGPQMPVATTGGAQGSEHEACLLGWMGGEPLAAQKDARQHFWLPVLGGKAWAERLPRPCHHALAGPAPCTPPWQPGPSLRPKRVQHPGAPTQHRAATLPSGLTVAALPPDRQLRRLSARAQATPAGHGAGWVDLQPLHWRVQHARHLVHSGAEHETVRGSTGWAAGERWEGMRVGQHACSRGLQHRGTACHQSQPEWLGKSHATRPPAALMGRGPTHPALVSHNLHAQQVEHRLRHRCCALIQHAVCAAKSVSGGRAAQARAPRRGFRGPGQGARHACTEPHAAGFLHPRPPTNPSIPAARPPPLHPLAPPT